MPVRAVVFDLFNTLTVPVDDGELRASAKLMAIAAGVDPEGFAERWFALWRQRLDGTFTTSDACLRGACEAVGASVDEASLARAVEVRMEFSRAALQPRADALATLARLRELGLRTALISNCSAAAPELWPTTPFAEAIDVPLFSCLEGMIKPDPEIYLRAGERLGVAPKDCLFVGDGGNHELSGAEQLGMRAVLIKIPKRGIAAFDSERDTWPGEAIEALSELPELIADCQGPRGL